jgi:hypothetical protein
MGAVVKAMGFAAVMISGMYLLTASSVEMDSVSWHDLTAMYVLIGGGAAIGLALTAFGRTKGRNRAAIAGLVAAILAVPAITMWWSGLPIVLASTAVILGASGLRHADRGEGHRRMSRVEMIIGAFVLVAITIGIITVIVSDFGPGLPS